MSKPRLSRKLVRESVQETLDEHDVCNDGIAIANTFLSKLGIELVGATVRPWDIITSEAYGEVGLVLSVQVYSDATGLTPHGIPVYISGVFDDRDPDEDTILNMDERRVVAYSPE